MGSSMGSAFLGPPWCVSARFLLAPLGNGGFGAYSGCTAGLTLLSEVMWPSTTGGEPTLKREVGSEIHLGAPDGAHRGPSLSLLRTALSQLHHSQLWSALHQVIVSCQQWEVVMPRKLPYWFIVKTSLKPNLSSTESSREQFTQWIVSTRESLSSLSFWEIPAHHAGKALWHMCDSFPVTEPCHPTRLQAPKVLLLRCCK